MKEENVSELLDSIAGLVEQLSDDKSKQSRPRGRSSRLADEFDVMIYVRLVQQWLWLMILSAILCGSAVYYLSSTATPIYRASSMWRVDAARGPAVQMSDLMLGERTAQTYARIMTSNPVLEKVAQRLDQQPADFFNTITEVTVSPIRDTQLINVIVEGIDPLLVALTANTLPEVFRQQLAAEQSLRFAESKNSLQRQMNSVSGEIERLQMAIEALGQSEAVAKEVEVAGLRNSLSLYQSQFASLLSRFEEIRLEESLTLDTMIIVNPAEHPDGPVRPRILVNTVLASVLGALLALGFGLLLRYLDNRVKSPRDVRRLTNAPCLGAVADISEGRRNWTPQDGLIALRSPRNPITETYRGIRTNLQFANVDRKIRSMLVTSALPGDGKTTTAANLAVVIAQAGHSVALLDADLRKPTLHKIFRVGQGPGLVDGLIREDWNKLPYIPELSLDNLFITPSGQTPPNPAELLDSKRMRQVLADLKKQVDIIIIDAPPLMAVSDAQILSALVDGVLYVVSRGTPRQAIVRSVESLHQVDAKMIGFVMNRMVRSDDEDYYNYYNHYYDNEPSPAPASLVKKAVPRQRNGSGNDNNKNGVAARSAKGFSDETKKSLRQTAGSVHLNGDHAKGS